MENCIVRWISIGKYSDTEAATVGEFLEAFRDGSFSPGASILLAQSPDGSTTIGFTKDGTIPGESDYYEQATFGRSLGVHHWVERSVVCSPARLSHEVAGTDGVCENGKVVEGEKGETNGINGKASKTEPVVFSLKWESVKVV